MGKCATIPQIALLLVLSITTNGQRRVFNKREQSKIICDGLVFNDVYYEKETLFRNFSKPYNLVMHKFSGILFFSYNIIDANGDVSFGIKACHVEKRKCNDVKGIPGGYALAYDPGNDDIFMGGEDGIYKYNFVTKTAEFFAEDGINIWGLFVKRNFYYIEYPSQTLYILDVDKFVPVVEAMNIEIDYFMISKEKDVYFANKTAIFKVPKPGKGDPIYLSEGVQVRQISEDGYGDFYVSASDGIYIEDKPYLRVKKVLDVDQVFGMAFDDKDNLIYSDIEGIYRLKPSDKHVLCYEAVLKHRWREAAGRRVQMKPFSIQKRQTKKLTKASKKMGLSIEI